MGGNATSRTTVTAALLIASALAAGLLPGEARAGDAMNVDSPLCKSIAAKLAERTHANFSHFGPNRTGVFFDHPYARDITISCSSRAFLNIEISTGSPYPNDLWFTLVSLAAGAISDSSSEQTESVVRKCQKEALMEPAGVGYGEIHDAHIECSVHTDPPETLIAVFLRDAENNKILGKPE